MLLFISYCISFLHSSALILTVISRFLNLFHDSHSLPFFPSIHENTTDLLISPCLLKRHVLLNRGNLPKRHVSLLLTLLPFPKVVNDFMNCFRGNHYFNSIAAFFLKSIAAYSLVRNRCLNGMLCYLFTT